MNETAILMEYVLNEKVIGTGYRVMIRKSTGGNLPKRAPYIRQVMRTAFGDTHPEPKVEHPKDITYTIHPRQFTEEKIIKTYHMIMQDLDEYIRAKR